MANRGRGRRGRPRGTGQTPPVFDQQAFTEAVGIAVAAIAQACAVVNQGESNDLQCIEAHHSPLGREGGLDDIRGTWDICVGAKRKEGPSSSSTGKRQRSSSSRAPQIQGQPGPMTCFYCHQPGHMKRDCLRRQESHGYGTPQSQSSVRRVRVASQDGQMVCYYCQQPGHMRRDCPQRQGSRGLGTVQSQLAVRQEQLQLVSAYPSKGQRDQYQSGSVTAWYEGATPVPSTAQAGHIDQGQDVGRDRPQDLQADSSG